MKFKKLVRDKIPEIIAASGKKVTFRTLSDEEYKIELEKKLDEEVAEFHESKSLEELIDIVDVLDALCVVYGFTYEKVSSAGSKKSIERGNFCKRIYLEEVEDD